MDVLGPRHNDRKACRNADASRPRNRGQRRQGSATGRGVGVFAVSVLWPRGLWMWAAYNLIVILQSEKTREIFLKDESTVTQKLTMEGDPAKTTVDLRCARRCSARAGTGAEISKSYVKELLTHYTSPKISAVFSRTPARPFSFRAGAARLRILSYETVEAEHRRTTPFVVYSGIVFLLFLPQPSFARLFVFAPASRAVRWRNGVRQI